MLVRLLLTSAEYGDRSDKREKRGCNKAKTYQKYKLINGQVRMKK